MSRFIPPAHAHAWSIVDQALVSGTNFLSGILLARVFGVETFGGYVIAMTYMLYANGFQTSIVMAPMMTAVPALAESEERAKLVRGFFVYALLILAVSVPLVLLVADVLGRFTASLDVGSLAVPLLAAMTAFQLQDWLRRALFVSSANRGVLIADLVAYGGQFLGLVALAFLERLTPASAFWMLSIAFFSSACGVIFALRLTPDFRGGVEVIRRQWRVSGNLLVSLQLQWLGSSGILLMGTGMIGIQAAGAIRAAQNLLGPVGVVFQWMDNVVPIKAAQRMRVGGVWGLWQYLFLIGTIGVLLIAAFTAILWIGDEILMVALYGEAYRPFAFLIVLQALYFLVGHVFRMFAYYYRAVERTNRLVLASIWWVLAAFAFALLTVGNWQERGIMAALVVGETAAVAYLVWHYRRAIKQNFVDAVSHVVLRRGNGSIHLILPAAAGPLLKGALSLYLPSRWTGRAYKIFLGALLPWQKRLHWGEPTSDLCGWRPYLDAIVSRIPGASADRVAALVSGKGSREKVVARLMNPEGHAVAYVRMARTEGVVDTLVGEREMLTFLSCSPVRDQVPSLLHFGWIEAGVKEPAYYLSQSVGGDAEAPKELTARHFDFLKGLVTESSVSWQKGIADLRMNCGGDMFDDALIHRTLDRLVAAPIDNLSECIEHGDFAPWNIRSRADGSIFVFDWEHGKQKGWPAMDAIHFEYQQAVLVDRVSPPVAVQRTITRVASTLGQNYLQRVGVDTGAVTWLMGFYLVRALIHYGNTGEGSQNLSVAHRGALVYLLEDRI